MSPSPTSLDSSSALRSDPALATKEVDILPQVDDGPPRKGVRFWLVFLSICTSLFLTALEYTAVSTALPTIVHDLNADDFVWVGSAYALAATAFLPATGGLAEVFGRRTSMLLAQALFALGSALCGSAKNMNWLIAARTIQGAGGGGLMAVTSIVISDLVPLAERGMYNGMVGLTWGIAAAIGPVVGGALAAEGQWRWLFYLNLPITGVAAALVIAFLKLKTPPGSFQEKMARMDWIGNVIVIGSTSSCVIGLTWAGVKFPWGSAQVLAPLIIGLVGLVVFFAYEATLAKHPLVPFALISNRTTLSGYIQTFIGSTIMISAIYFLPVYYQACQDASPVRSGVELFGLAMPLLPVLIITGGSINRTKSYRVQLWLAFALSVAGFGAMTTLTADSPTAHGIGFPVLVGIGAGIYCAATYFPVLAPLPVTENAHALALFAFCRAFACVWGVTIGTAVLQTQLADRLPADFAAQVPGGVPLAFALIPRVRTLEPPALRHAVKVAFAHSCATIWAVMAALAGAGLLAALAMRALPLHTDVDRKWALEGADADADAEARRAQDVELQVAELAR